MRTTEERFWSKVNKNGPTQPHMETACWVWTGWKDRRLYGHIKVGGKHGKSARAHRVSWMLSYGDIPDGLVVMHKCDNPSCVRIDHLQVGTQAENNHDRAAKGRSATGDRNGARAAALRRNRPPKRGRPPRGEEVERRKLTEADVIRLRQLAGDGVGLRELGRRFGIAYNTARKIALRQLWTHVAAGPNAAEVDRG